MIRKLLSLSCALIPFLGLMLDSSEAQARHCRRRCCYQVAYQQPVVYQQTACCQPVATCCGAQAACAIQGQGPNYNGFAPGQPSSPPAEQAAPAPPPAETAPQN